MNVNYEDMLDDVHKDFIATIKNCAGTDEELNYALNTLIKESFKVGYRTGYRHGYKDGFKNKS